LEYANRRQSRAVTRARLAGDHGTTPFDHPILALARDIVSQVIRPDWRTLLYRPTFDDAVGDTVVALLSGDDPHEAARGSVKEDRLWLWRTRPIDTVLLADQERPLIWMERE
jgi:hypothetical protein